MLLRNDGADIRLPPRAADWPLGRNIRSEEKRPNIGAELSNAIDKPLTAAFRRSGPLHEMR
jgi:hypothetical protein